MELIEFIALIEAFSNGHLDKSALSGGIAQYLEQNPGIAPNDLLELTQAKLTNGEISPKNFRGISEIITELNIRRALTAQPAKTQEPNIPHVDETLIIAPPNVAPQEETLILSDSNSNSSSTAKPTITSDQRRPPLKTKSPRQSRLIGQVLKGRFELLEMIGRGGMGMVYKAKDLVKVQARDQNPYVAIKVLSEKFKKHSRAFIAMQREASKAQRLAHPNIATVYDFDHDGDTIYMTMELLHGQPFDKIIAGLPSSGLPKLIALNYIEQLCNGLAYAHEQNLIHCDLKPANIFLCDNNTVKLLDFGITRAIKKEQQKGGDETLFDPASLKALTPAYASVEMFRGDPPDPRDDIYALACVAYEILTGVHPYKKVAAHKALELSLKPPSIKALNRRQQKSLFDALTLERGKRTATVEKFISGFRRPDSRVKQLALGGIITILLGAVLLIKPIQTHRQEEAQLAMIEAIKDGDESILTNMLSSINDKDDNTRAYLTSILRQQIISHYQKKINFVITHREKRYNYPEAIRLLNEVKALYPDSVSLAEAEKQLLAKKDKLVADLLGTLSAMQNPDSGETRILEIIQEADPNHPILKEKRN